LSILLCSFVLFIQKVTTERRSVVTLLGVSSILC
jgi:hypothetical protein